MLIPSSVCTHHHQQSEEEHLALVAAVGDDEVLRSATTSTECAGCPQVEPHVAKEELKTLRRHDSLPVMICAATGSEARIINGTYFPTSESVNGQTVFVKESDAKECLYFDLRNSWAIATVADKNKNNCVASAISEKGLAHPSLAKKWMVLDGTAWVHQPVEVSVIVSLYLLRNPLTQTNFIPLTIFTTLFTFTAANPVLIFFKTYF